MRPIEARWLRGKLNGLEASHLSPMLEIGSSSLEFRTKTKPHIEEFIHAPLRKSGVRIVTADLRDAEGIEIVGDIFDPAVRKKLIQVKARSILMCNLLEHIQNPGEFAAECASLIEPGGYVVVTVPHRYPYHLDPIDTMFRPSPEQIHSLFPGAQLIDCAVLIDGSWWTDLRKAKSLPRALATLIAEFLRLLTFRGGLERAKSRASRISYLFRNYQISAVILRVKGS